MITDEQLRRLDRAPRELTPAQEIRAAALLERVVAEHVPSAERVAIANRRNRLRVGALLGAGAAAVAIAIALPALTPQSAAVASWTAVAEAVSPQDLVTAERACRENLAYSESAADIPLALAERRGRIVALLFRQDDPATDSSCLLDLPRGSDSPREVTSGVGGSSGPMSTPTADSYLKGAEGQFTIGGQVLSVVAGAVGENVTAITVHGADVEAVATITDGKFAAWLPGALFVDPTSPDAVSYDLTLADGTVILDAVPDRP